jgi:uncharacterized Zn finger protein (UPF0148 family)
MAFKTKTKTRLLIDDRQTLDAKHNNILKSFTENKDKINILYKELDTINNKLNDFNTQNASLSILNIDLQTQIWFYDDKKKEIEIEINRIENNVDETEYMLKTGKLLSNYYKIINEEKKITISDKINSLNSKESSKENSISESSKYNSKDNSKDNSKESSKKDDNKVKNNINSSGIPNKKKKNITDWFQFNDDSESQINKDNINTEKINTNDDINNNNINTDKINNDNTNTNDDTNSNNINTDKINNDTNKKNTNSINNTNTNIYNDNQSFMFQSKDVIYDKYMKLIDKNYISTINNNKDNDIFDTCNQCSVEMLLNNNTGQLTCPKCGYIENIIVDSDKPSFKEPPKEMTSFCYKRINHLNEFLAQFQAKETTDIPETVYNDIIMEIKKERIRNMALITPEKMRTILKKIKKNDYYEHIPYIINQLNGLPAPVIAPEIEEIIRGMFKAIQIPFEKYCPFKRKNFLSYNYVMYKFFELLELDEYLTCFQLLKSRTKLHQQDQIWKNICKDLNWEYINSL